MVPIPDMLPEVEPEGEEEVYEHGRAEGGEGKIDKIKPDAAGGHADLFSQVAANAEGRSFKKVF